LVVLSGFSPACIISLVFQVPDDFPPGQRFAWEGFRPGKTVPCKILRQGGFGLHNSGRSIGEKLDKTINCLHPDKTIADSRPNAAGHDGAMGQIAWGDPESGLSFAFVTNTGNQRGYGGGMSVGRICDLSTLAGATVSSTTVLHTTSHTCAKIS
jgi:CubicO group peptidase (beta-lactamase class C family)